MRSDALKAVFRTPHVMIPALGHHCVQSQTLSGGYVTVGIQRVGKSFPKILYSIQLLEFIAPCTSWTNKNF